MKRILVIVIVLIVTNVFGIIGDYPFNGNANDESGNGNNGVVYGASLCPDRFNNENSSYQFGDGNYIAIQHAPSLNITEQISITAWVYRESSTNNWQSIICKGETNSMASPYALLIRSNKIALLLNRTECYGSISVPINEWVHIAATWDSETVKYYINGELDPNQDSFAGTLNTFDEDLIIGKDAPGNVEWFEGRLDDIKIFNSGLSDSDIENIFLGSTNAVNFSADPVSGFIPFEVNFTNLTENSTNWEWDFENDGYIDSYEENPSFYYIEAGIYDVKLTATIGSINYSTVKENYIVAELTELEAPQNLTVSISDSGVILSWDYVSNAEHYLIYSSDEPNGVYEYLGHITSTTVPPETTFIDTESINDSSKKFYRVVAAEGDLW